jgi:hypothetical protein
MGQLTAAVMVAFLALAYRRLRLSAAGRDLAGAGRLGTLAFSGLMLPWEKRSPEMHRRKSAADEGGADDGNIGHVLEDDSGPARGVAGLLGEVLASGAEFLQWLGPGRAMDAAVPVGHGAVFLCALCPPL